jgi:TetR/AcrR family transcriptional regulator, fatty acid metabolism regulator protein
LWEVGDISEPEESRERILDKALDLFSSKGFQETDLGEIAEAARASKGAIFFHFPSKERLFLALVDQFADLLERRVTEAIAQEREGVARVKVALETCVATFGRYRRPAKILLVQAVGMGATFEKKRLEVNDRFARLIETYLREAVAVGDVPPVDTEVVAYAWMGAIYGVIIRWVYTGEPEPERILRTLTPVLLRSIGYEAAENHESDESGK